MPILWRKPEVDDLEVFISTAAIFGIGLMWTNFNEKVFKTVCRLISAPFTAADGDNLHIN